MWQVTPEMPGSVQLTEMSEPSTITDGVGATSALQTPAPVQPNAHVCTG